MIREQWYVVLDARELGSKPLGVVRLGERLVFWRDAAGRPLCHVDRCAHRGASLALGQVLPKERLQCPFHGLEYDPSGRCVKIPANGASAPVPEAFRLCSYPAREVAGWIWIWWGEGAPQAEPGYFKGLDAGWHSSTVQDPWDNHYSRVIENQLDQAHLPFVHHNTIGRGMRTVVDGPGILHAGEGFFVYVYNRLDDGSPRRTSAEVAAPDPTRSYWLEFRFPNLWHNRISEKLQIVGAFVPVDGERTILYLRTYQRFMRLPLVKDLVHALFNRVNLVVAHQDRRIVNTQLPKAEGIGAGEVLFPGDLPIMEYRKLRLAARKRLTAS
jgi:phenylpropionate dioxygenase-like ring-hydroxylating dioxygenase large terminal subunit